MYLWWGLTTTFIPPITTYEVDIKEMARKTIHKLLKKMEPGHYKQGISVVEGHMVLKESVKRLA